MPEKRKLTAGEIVAIIARASAYVDAQLVTMAKYGSAPTLSEEERALLVRDCAKPVLEIAKWTPKPTV